MTDNKVDDDNKCPSCGSSRIIQDYVKGDLLCGICGTVISETHIDPGPEWRAYNSEESSKKERTGSPLTDLLHDRGLATEIGWPDKDSSGKRIPTRNRPQLFRLRKWQRRARLKNANERNISFALGHLDKIAAKKDIPKPVREQAARIYKDAVEQGLIRGRSIESVVSAALYASCRLAKVPRTLDEIAEAADIGRKQIGRTYRFLARKLDLTLDPTSPHDYVQRFCAGLMLPNEVERASMEILDEASKKDIISGKGPNGVAAAAIYIAAIKCKKRRTQREVAEVAGVTEVTIRNRYQEIVNAVDIENLDL